MLTLLTVTGCRPEAWALCERWMRAQDYTEPVQWIIVDDGEHAQQVRFSRAGWTLVLVRPVPAWQPGQNTQARNLLAGLEVAGDAEAIAVIEDDDYYAPTWLSAVAEVLETAELVGEHSARYYNVPQRKGRQLRNDAHASLCSTAVRGPAAIAALREACAKRPKFIDLELWQHFRRTRRLFGGHRVVGMKGLPGRMGIGMGHRAEFVGQRDPDGRLLRDWIGKDAEVYLR